MQTCKSWDNNVYWFIDSEQNYTVLLFEIIDVALGIYFDGLFWFN